MTERIYPPHLCDRLSKYVALLASEHDAEVVAAARQMQAALKAEGVDLNDLAAAIERGGFEMTDDEVQNTLAFFFEDLFVTIQRGHWTLTQAERCFVTTMEKKRRGMSVDELVWLRNLGIEVNRRVGKRH